jgi:hypothetical protein
MPFYAVYKYFAVSKFIDILLDGKPQDAPLILGFVFLICGFQ